MTVSFRSLTEADLPLLCDWLNRPHLQKWWRESEISIDTVRRKYLPRIAGDDAARPFVALEGGEPGFMQEPVIEIRTDPRPDNARAIGCYEKVGFRRIADVDTPDGPAVMMVLRTASTPGSAAMH